MSLWLERSFANRRVTPHLAVTGRFTDSFSMYAALSLVLAFVVVSPALWCGLIGDDIINALVPEWVQTTHGSLYQLIFATTLDWARLAGRLFPGSLAVTYTVWNYAYLDPIYPKAISLIGYLVCLGVTADFIRRFTNSAWAALIFILLATVCVQMRAWYDPILCFPLLVPLTLTIVMLQASLLHRYLIGGSPWYLSAGFAAFAMGLLTYELAFVAIPIDLIIILVAGANRTNKLLITATIFGIFFVYLLATYALRLPGAPGYEGIVVSPDVKKFAHAFGVNLFAAIPLSYLLTNPALIPSERSLVDVVTVFPIIAAIATSFFLMWRKLATRPHTDLLKVSATVSIGVLLITVPAAMLATSARYQNVVTKFGEVYIQGFFEEIGLAIVAACAMSKLASRFDQPVRHAWLILGACFALMSALTFTSNVLVVSAQNQWADKMGRGAFIKAMRGGVLDAVPDGSLLIFEQPRAWLDARLVHLFSGKLVRVTANGVNGIEDVELGPYAGVFSVSIPVVPSEPWFRRDVPPDVTISPAGVK